MRASNFTLHTADGAELFIYCWRPPTPPKAAVQIAHGMAEHAARYARLAEALTGAGYAVYAGDHRGHGRTAKTSDDLGFFAERDGWQNCIEDLGQIHQHIAEDCPGLPILLLGHSMGSILAQHCMSEGFNSKAAKELAGVVLSGSSGTPPALAGMGRLIARMERLRLGSRGRSPLVFALTFKTFNKQFAPARTDFDWLSRDSSEVDKYVADPLCGFPATVQLWIDLLDAWAQISRPSQQARIPKRLPIYMISGGRDPVSDNTKRVALLLSAYQAAGLERVQHRFYPEGRHELLNETNRNEVTGDLIQWMDGVITASDAARF